ncbi:MAG: hypothetical protein J6X86_05105 [Bacteroidales bacterium]|nr:hypothetical protein [Bacteroidales bacterium]
MKKFLLPIIASFVLLSGCSEKAHIITDYYKVHNNQWQPSVTLNGDGTYTTDYYYSEWEDINITGEVIDNGVVLVYYIDADGRDNLLPYTLYMQDPQSGALYQERIEYDIEVGKITFKVKTSDFGPTSINNGTMTFKVSVISNY